MYPVSKLERNKIISVYWGPFETNQSSGHSLEFKASLLVSKLQVKPPLKWVKDLDTNKKK